MWKSPSPNTCLAPLDPKIWGYCFYSLVSARKTHQEIDVSQARQFGFHLPFLCLRPACHLLAYPIVLRLQLHGLSFEMRLWNQRLPSDAPWKDGCQVTAILPAIRKFKKRRGKLNRLSTEFHLYLLLFRPCHWFDSKVKFARRSSARVLRLDWITRRFLETCRSHVLIMFPGLSARLVLWPEFIFPIQIWRHTNATIQDSLNFSVDQFV